MSLSYFWSYIYHLTQARSEYYVHSPFVYTLMCRCLRRHKGLLPENLDRLHDRLQRYLAQQGIAPKLVRIPPGQSPDKAFYALEDDQRAAVFIDMPHRTPKREAAWQTLCRDPNISLTIDLFRAALVFPRHPMSKEHFYLRYF